jgi:AcrR family transcriptional regulator
LAQTLRYHYNGYSFETGVGHLASTTIAQPTIAQAEGQLTWQQTKSQLTRTSILQAALECFYELGYANTTTDNIAKQAGVSRGAMLHHFPSRFDLISATVAYLNQQRIESFAREEIAVQKGAEHTRIEEGIDTYWRQLNTPVFIVFHELKIAARTDTELAKVVAPALKEFEAAWYEAVKDVFPDLALSEAFSRANYLTKYMLEGMAVARFASDETVPEKMMLNWLKRELKRSFQDVLNSVKRPMADEG